MEDLTENVYYTYSHNLLTDPLKSTTTNNNKRSILTKNKDNLTRGI